MSLEQAAKGSRPEQAVEQNFLRVNSPQCSRVRHRLSKCTRCADHCPQGAITVGETLTVNKYKCNNCGLCAAVCPAGALECGGPSSTELVEQLAARSDKSLLIFACGKMAHGHREGQFATKAIHDDRAPARGVEDHVIRVSCLGRLDEGVLLGAFAHGVQEIQLVDGPCQTCASAVGRTVVEQAAERTRALLTTLGVQAQISFVSELPGAVVPPPAVAAARAPERSGLSRRGFLSLFTRQAAGTVAVTVSAALPAEPPKTETPARTVGELPTYVPERIRLALDAVKRLKPGADELRVRDTPWANFLAGPACNICQMCAFFCPTGALRKTQPAEGPGLDFINAYCSNCRLCEDICYRHAVTLGSEVDLAEIAAERARSLRFSDAQLTVARLTPEDKAKRFAHSLLRF